MIFIFVILLFIGFITGLLCSLLGVGGGFLISLILLIYFSSLNIENAIKFAVGTSLLVVFLNYLYSFYLYRNEINLDIIKKSLFLGFISALSSYIFGYIAIYYISSNSLVLLFGILLIILSINILRPIELNINTNLLGVICGFFSGFFGIGGGIILTPLLSLKYNIKIAVRYSHIALTLSSLGGVVSYLTANVGNTFYNIGYVSIPVAILIFIPSLISSKIGKRIYLKCNEKDLRIILSSILFLVGMYILIRRWLNGF